MELSVQSRGDGMIRLAVVGRVTLRDVGGPDPLRAVAGEQVYGERILINLQLVDFLDSSGVGWLLNCHIRCREAGGALVLHTIHPLALKVLTTLRMHNVLTLAENEEDAIKLAPAGEGAAVNAPDFRPAQVMDLDSRQAIDAILAYAVGAAASDVFLMAEESSYHVTVRRMGTMETMAVVPKELGVLMVNLIKSNAGMDLAEKRRPLDGRWHHEVNGQTIHFRINSMGTLHGEDVTLRLLNRRSGLLSMERLGLIPSQLADIRGMLGSCGGLILVTGPTGGGKTTTLYACLQELNDGTRKINTLEDPVEYALPGVRQSQVNPRMGLSFAELLRGTLRQNPDVIMVGEIRDEETATTAVRAANSGHLVITTLHAPMATSAVHALLAYNVHPFFLANSLLGVIAQRLVRVLSEKTRVAYDISQAPDTFQEVKSMLAPGQGHVIYGPDPADPHAHQGYTAQTGLFEVLPVNQELRELVAAARPASELRKRAIELGMLDFHRAGLLKVAQGVTGLEEVVRSLPNESLEPQNWYRRPEREEE